MHHLAHRLREAIMKTFDIRDSHVKDSFTNLTPYFNLKSEGLDLWIFSSPLWYLTFSLLFDVKFHLTFVLQQFYTYPITTIFPNPWRKGIARIIEIFFYFKEGDSLFLNAQINANIKACNFIESWYKKNEDRNNRIS